MDELNIELNSLLGVTGDRVRAAYNPGCNGLVERQYRTTERAMVASLLEKQANWYYILPSLQMSFRMHTYSSTGLTAHEMMFGRKPAQLPILLHSEEIKDPCPIQTELLESAEKLPKHVCSNAADSIKKAQAKQAMAFACRHESPVPPGRFVSRLQDVSDQIAVIHEAHISSCLLYTSPSPRDGLLSRMPSSA